MLGPRMSLLILLVRGRLYAASPYFHLAGFLSLLVNPIFIECSSPVLGPPLTPPSGAFLKKVMRCQTLRTIYLPSSIAEQLLMEPGGPDFLKSLDCLRICIGINESSSTATNHFHILTRRPHRFDPDFADIRGDDDLFSCGLDSVMISQL
jgi:hypothetical protein